jgi:hypothetical protein
MQQSSSVSVPFGVEVGGNEDNKTAIKIFDDLLEEAKV